jgi:hypothetical protein
MKGNLLIFFATSMLFASLGFAFQGQEDPKKTKPVEVKEPRLADEVKKELDAVRRELEEERRKSDSINAEREVNVSILKKSVTDLQSANKAYRRSLDRLVFIVGKFNPDSVMKYYGEFQEIPSKDTLKKKIESPSIDPDAIPTKRKNFFNKIFNKIGSIFR